MPPPLCQLTLFRLSVPSPSPPRPEGLAGDEVTSPPKPHPASTPILGIRKYDEGTSSPGAGAACVLADLPLCLSLSWESQGQERSQKPQQSPHESPVTGWDGRSPGLSDATQGCQRAGLGLSLEGLGPFQQEHLSWSQRPGSVPIPPLRLSFLIHKMRELDLPSPQVASGSSFLRLTGCWALIFVHSAHSGLRKLPEPSPLQHPISGIR